MGLAECVQNLNPIEFALPSGDEVSISISNCIIGTPSVPLTVVGTSSRHIYPLECRQRKFSYRGKCTIQLKWSVNGVPYPSIEKEMGDLPIMLKVSIDLICKVFAKLPLLLFQSKLCNIKNFSPSQLVKVGEQEDEWGGYFVVKGNQKLIRMLLQTRKNYPISLRRGTWKDRGQMFSDLGVIVRSVSSDQSSVNNVLHFLHNGTAKFMFSSGRAMSYVPVLMLMKALVNVTDEFMYSRLVAGYE